MEFVVYFDSELKNRQVIKTHDKKVEVKPRDIALSVCPHYFAVSKNGGPLMKNPDLKQ